MRRRSIALIAALAGLTSVASVAPAASGVAGFSCATPRYVHAVGLACPTPDGLWEVVTEDGYRTTTHGPDSIQEIHGAGEMLRVKRRKPSCVSDPSSQYHIQIVYTTTTDYPDRYGERLSYLRRMLERVNGMLYKEGAEFGRPMRYRMACVNGNISILNAKLPITSGANEGVLGGFSTIVAALRRAGYTNQFAKYWLFIDTPSPFGSVAGIASYLNDDRLLANNASNFGPGYGIFWDVGEAFTSEAMMHEAAHLHGAVQGSAPNSSRQFGGGGHCIDDSDVMCYKDWPGDSDSGFRWTVCGRLHFDCGHNDYFHPRPGNGNYLKTHWNLGSPLNRFFAGCLYQTDTVNAGALGAQELAGDIVGPFRPLIERSHTIPKKCRGHDFALTGAYSPQPRQVDPVVGLTPDTHLALALLGSGPPDHIINGGYGGPNNQISGFTSGIVRLGGPDFNVCFYRGSRQLRCFNEIGTDQGRVPGNATKAVVSFNVGVQGIYIFSVI